MRRFDGENFHVETRELPHEAAVAISVGGSTHAVMMATPWDLEDFACGFLRSEGVIDHVDDLSKIRVQEVELGIDLQLQLREGLADDYQEQRRAMIGPVGCGLCGVESLDLAVPDLAAVETVQVEPSFPFEAMKALARAQKTREISGAMHGAALMNREGEMLIAREDIGRHNAMDKVIGGAMRQGIDCQSKIMVITSRVSLDLVVKVVRAGVGMLIARATPSDLAMKYADLWNLTLVAPVFANEYFQNGE